jgi:hypothetical protein
MPRSIVSADSWHGRGGLVRMQHARETSAPMQHGCRSLYLPALLVGCVSFLSSWCALCLRLACGGVLTVSRVGTGRQIHSSADHKAPAGCTQLLHCISWYGVGSPAGSTQLRVNLSWIACGVNTGAACTPNSVVQTQAQPASHPCDDGTSPSTPSSIVLPLCGRWQRGHVPPE